MIPRYLLLGAVLISVAVSAATKKAEEKFEYLLPEDWQETQENGGSATKPTSLELTPKSFQAGMKKYVKEDPDCKDTLFGAPNLLKERTVLYQEMRLEGATADIILNVANTGKITGAKFISPNTDQAHVMLMVCATYAVMRTMQPGYEKPEAAKRDTLHLWQEAQNKPFSKAFFFNTFEAQMIPFQVTIN